MKEVIAIIDDEAGGQVPDPSTLSRAVPIYRTSSYIFKPLSMLQIYFR